METQKIYLYIATSGDGTVISANTNFDLCEIYVKDFFGISEKFNYENPAEYVGFIKNIYEDEKGEVIESEDNTYIGKWIFNDPYSDEPVKHAINLYKILVDKEV